MQSKLFTKFLRRPAAVLAGLAMAAVMIPAHATELVTNGGFDATSSGPGQVGYNTNLTGWNITGGYTFVFAAGTGDTTGAQGYFVPPVKFWGPNTGVANGFPGSSPSGGNYVAQDPNFSAPDSTQVPAPLTQTITGLTAGDKYTVSFEWAGAQQFQFDGETTMGWIVGFGSGPTQETSLLTNPDQGFQDWREQSFTFTATGASDTLSFLAKGGPSGEPPFALLDNVSVTEATSPVPEPGSLALILTGFAGVGGMVRSRFSKSGI